MPPPVDASTLTFTTPSSDHVVLGFPDPNNSPPPYGPGPAQPLSITAQVGNLPPPPTGGSVSVHCDSMNFVINGQTFAASSINTTPTFQTSSGVYKLNIAAAPNPTEFIYSATANLTITTNSGGYPSHQTITTETVTSPTQRFIVGDIYVKGTRWTNTAASIWDSKNTVLYPNTARPYHYGYDYANNSVQYFNPAVYVQGSNPGLQVDMTDQDIKGSPHPFVAGPLPSAPVLVNWTVTLKKLSGAFEPGYPATGTILPGTGSFALPIGPLSNVVDKLTSYQQYNFLVHFSDDVGGDNHDGWVTPPSTYRTQSGVAYTPIQLYVTYGTPVCIPNPNEVNYTAEQNPWLGVLDNSCTFAADHGSTGAADVAWYLTRNLFFSKRFYYPSDTASHWTAPDTYYTFLLKAFLNTTGLQKGNCMDVSDYLSICAYAQGLSLNVEQYENSVLGVVSQSFATNPICPIGSDPTQDSQYNNPIVANWSWHQIVVSGNNIYDVCAAQKMDLQGNTFRNPPSNWPLVGFWQTPNSLPAPYNTPPWWGLVKSPTLSYPVAKDNSGAGVNGVTGPGGMYFPVVQ